MQVVKGDRNGYPVLGGIAGLPCPGGCKYRGLAFQVGGWATGRQPVTVKQQTAGKPKLWHRNSPTEWNRLRQWKRICDERLVWQLGMRNCVQTDTNKCKITIMSA